MADPIPMWRRHIKFVVLVTLLLASRLLGWVIPLAALALLM